MPHDSESQSSTDLITTPSISRSQALWKITKQGGPFAISRLIVVGADVYIVILMSSLGKQALAASTDISTFKNILSNVPAGIIFAKSLLAKSALGDNVAKASVESKKEIGKLHP